MKRIRSIKNLEAFSGEFISFCSTDPIFEVERCLLINKGMFGRVSQRCYEYKGELAYNFSILRKDKKWTEYCYLTDPILALTPLKMRLATEKEKAALEAVVPLRFNKFAAGECFSDGCKLDESPETEPAPPKKYHATNSAFPILGLDKLDDNIMLWSVILHLFYKFKNWVFKKPKEKSLCFTSQEKDFFQEQMQLVLGKLDGTEKELKQLSKASSREMQWAFEGVKNYRADLKIVEKKFDRRLVKKKFNKKIADIVYFIEEVQKELPPLIQSDKPPGRRLRSLW